MSVKRLTDPVYLQFIWNAIETTTKEGSESTFPTILSYIRSKCDMKCTETKLSSELSHAIGDGCIKIEQHVYELVDVYSTFQRGKSDWYCYECHGPGRVVSCPTCFRVFHSDCLPTASESHWACRLPVEDSTIGSNLEPGPGFPPNHPCPVCQRLERVTDSKVTSASDLQKIFSCALDWIRGKVHWRTMQKVGYLYEPQRNDFLVYRQVNTRMIGDKMRADPTKDGYPNRTSLLVELDNLVHNAAVLYGSKNDMSNMARQIRSQMRRAMRESAFCVDCYLRPTSMSSVARLTAPCRVPHRLLWFQHNGWSFRPCKMLYESSEGYEVICFGGRHEREFVSRSRAVDMTFTALELGLRLTPSLKKALDEAEEYKANQSAHDRGVSTFMAFESKPSRRRSHGPDKGNSGRQSPTLCSEKVEMASRKRKAGPKYHSAFGSVDSGSTLSANSTVSEPKRRKSHRSPSFSEKNGIEVSRPAISLNSYGPPVQTRNRDLSADSSHEFTDGDSLSSTSLDSDSDTGVSPSPAATTRPITVALRPTISPTVPSSQSPRTEHAHLVTRISLSQVTTNENTVTEMNKIHSDRSGQSTTSVASMPGSASNTTGLSNPKPSHRVIRIKPLPVRPAQHNDNVSVSSPEHTLDLQQSPLRVVNGMCKSRVKSKKQSTSTSSSASSALSYPSSSGHDTIPAVALSLDGQMSSESVRSSSASRSTLSSKLETRVGRLTKHEKQSGLFHIKRTHVTRTSRPKVRLASDQLDGSKPGLPVDVSKSRRSTSSLSSLGDSDLSSSASSPLSNSRSPSPSSSDLSSSSSTTVSSSSTKLPFSSSTTRHIAPSNPVQTSFGQTICTNSILKRSDPVFSGYETRTQLNKNSRGHLVDHTSTADSLKPLAKVAPTLLSGNSTATVITTTTVTTPTTIGNSSVSNLRCSPPRKTVLKSNRHNRGSAPSGLTRPALDESPYGESDHNLQTPTKTVKKRQPHSNTRSALSSSSSPSTTITGSVPAVAVTTVATSVFQPNNSTGLGMKAVPTTGVWPLTTTSGTRPPSFPGGQTPTMHQHHNSCYNTNSTSSLLTNTGTITGVLSTTTTNNIGPTPPFSCNSSSSSASSCYSSVSPAALSTTSGLGSSVSDPKSVDASPGEVTAAMLGNPYFCCTSNGNNANHSTVGATSSTQLDSSLLKSLEDRIHRIYADRLIALTTERDQACEEVSRQSALIAQLKRDHEAEVKRVKQRTWCQVCLNEAFYHCCLGTAYCSKTCQWQHWEAQHSQTCRRRAEAQMLQEQQQQQTQQSQSAPPVHKR
ncbi:Zinc finger MYND domain-containing protein 11 [Fasciola gigantica]|uniref:Zinc finger MYND domain-containing protein 11 n=1 Tax=Fasciola gigantica TaxID=46835 RepID=A0A504YV60_FASGI|nr:Zinc finger MYND domain-containing protein 11 [Fasciola gigantica]